MSFKVMESFAMRRAGKSVASPTRQRPAAPRGLPSADRLSWIARATGHVLALIAATTALAQEPASVRGPAPTAAKPASPPYNESREIAAVAAKAKGAGLGQFQANHSDHFLAIGDAPESFRREALDICEKLTTAFLNDLRKRGFTLELPNHRLTVVILKDAQSYAWYNGDAELPTNVGGHYDLDTNRLVVYDFRPRNEGVETGARRANLLSLVHEATHLLCYNTGLLSRESETPDCISEGLATYAELWRPSDKLKFGGNNPFRLKAAREAGTWIPLASLFTTDEPFENEQTQQLAYAESWLLIHDLLRADNALKLRDYLAKLSTNTDPTKRRQLAESCFGPLSKLDKHVIAHASKLPSR